MAKATAALDATGRTGGLLVIGQTVMAYLRGKNRQTTAQTALDYAAADLSTTDQSDDAWSITVVTVGDTATRIDATPLPNRRRALVKNIDPAVALYIGPDDTVTDSGGTRGGQIVAGAAVELKFGSALEIWGIVGSGLSADVELWQEA